MSLPILHILHLTRREDRLQQLIRQMEWNKVAYQLWEGEDNPNNVKQAITKGHKRIIQYAKDHDLPFINIAEDDIIFTHKDSYKYFNEQVPDDYDLFCGVLFAGTVEDGRVLNGMSATHTLYRISQRFYQFVLDLPDDIHIDRGLGEFAFKFKYQLVNPQVCYQSGGVSDQLFMTMYYWPYMENKEFYGQDGKKCVDGIWVNK